MPANSRSVLLVPAHHLFNITVYNFMLKFALNRQKYVDISVKKDEKQQAHRVTVLHEMQLHARFMKGFLKYYVQPTYRESSALVTARSKFFFQHHQAEYRDVPWGIFLRTCVQGAFVRRPIHNYVIQGGQEPSFTKHHSSTISSPSHHHIHTHHKHMMRETLEPKLINMSKIESERPEHYGHHQRGVYHQEDGSLHELHSHHEHDHHPHHHHHSHLSHHPQFHHHGHNGQNFAGNEFTSQLTQQLQFPYPEYDETHLYQMYLYFEEDLKVQMQQQQKYQNQSQHNHTLTRNVPPIVQPIIDTVLHLVRTAIAHLTSYLQVCTHPWKFEHLQPGMLPVPARMEGFLSIRDILREIVFVIDNDLCGRFQFELAQSAFYTNVILHTEILSKIHVQLLFTILLCIEARISGRFVLSRR